jgi:hypothetical protein
MNIAKPFLTALAAASVTLAGCAGATGEVEDVATTQQADVESNGVQLNGVQLNGVQLNGVQLNGVQLNGVQLNGLSIPPGDLKDASSALVFQYLVECALPADKSFTVKGVDGVTYTFSGALGLAPEWGAPGGKCDESCQTWVSACMIARLDFTGAHELISLRGDKPGLAVSPSEAATYTDREATYYGNIFASPPQLYACLSPGQTQDPRVCGPSIKNCGVDVLGSCDQLCGKPRADGSFPDCAAPDADDHGCHADHDDIYHASITVYLP